MKHLKPSLGDLEREVMSLVWKHGPTTSDALRERLSRPLKESTVRTVLRRLEEKQHLNHTVENRTFIYAATEARGQAAAKAVKRIVDWFCDGSVEEVLVGMVDSTELTSKQLDVLAQKIEEARKQKRTSGSPAAKSKRGERT